MTIFSKKNSDNGKDTKFMGAYVPIDLYQYIALFTLSNSMSKTEIFLNALIEWKEQYEKDTPADDLKGAIVMNILLPTWKKFRGKREKYITKFSAELKKQALSEDNIKDVIKLFKNATKNR